MLYYDRIDVSEGTDINRTNDLCECIVFRYNYFHHNFFRLCVCNGCM